MTRRSLLLSLLALPAAPLARVLPTPPWPYWFAQNFDPMPVAVERGIVGGGGGWNIYERAFGSITILDPNTLKPLVSVPDATE